MGQFKLAVIAGSGFYDPAILSEVEELEVGTPYGPIKPFIGRLGELKVAFLPRHGSDHTVLPHQLNYRANLWGLKVMGVERIIALTAVGSLRTELPGGSLVLVDQFLDFTKQRPLTFFESGEVAKAHLDLSVPFCSELRRNLLDTANGLEIKLKDGGCYVCTEGPRYETPAEVRMFQTLGGDLVGMTLVPEVVLARELGICYANLSIVTNLAAGIASGALDHSEVVRLVGANQGLISGLLSTTLRAISINSACSCRKGREE